jgi:superoxide dismutase, Cu-Zn family
VSNHRWLFLSLLFWSSVAFGQTTPSSAHADIVDAQGQKIGSAAIVPAYGGVRVELKVSQLPPGIHAIHIHSVGKCIGPDFKSAGGHLNPEGKPHGKDNPAGPHAGDLMNFEVGADGNGKATLVAPHATLGSGPNSLFHEGGTSLVIHEKADDYKTDPAGNSGARIACGVINR